MLLRDGTTVAQFGWNDLPSSADHLAAAGAWLTTPAVNRSAAQPPQAS